MDHAVMRSPQSALDDAFHAMIALSRATAPPELPVRLARLQRLRALLTDNEQRLEAAISADFGHRARVETTIAETLFLLTELKHTIKHLPRWMAARRIATTVQFWPATNRLMPQPLGVVGIIAPWNYPLQLTLAPAIGAIAAGNRVMIKPSEVTPRFAGLLNELVGAAFEPTELFITGIDDDIAQTFAGLPFDHLVFTGSTRVGRLVAEAAARNLTPVTLELGGKSPVIIDSSANLEQAAQRIVYAKLLNAGQTCIAPDYVLVPEARLSDFAAKAAAQMLGMFGSDPDNTDYTAVISDHHYARLEALAIDATAKGAKLLQPAPSSDPAWKRQRKFPPTLVVGASPDMTIMREEIFGPLLPVMGYRERSDAIGYINAHDRPLALYWFGTDEAARDEVLARTVSGGVTINDCLLHFAQINQPMGGVGASGTGAYHGQWGFDTFSKLKPVFYRSRFNRMSDLYPPYGTKIARIEKLLRWMS